MKRLFDLAVRLALVAAFVLLPATVLFNTAHAQSQVDPSIIVALAEQARADFKDTVREAAKIGIWAFTRSVVVTFENHTDLVLSKTGDHHSSGSFGKMLPYPRLNPGGITVFNSRSTGILRGAVGRVEYGTSDGSLSVQIKWYNPWKGPNHCSAETEGALADQYMVYVTCGGGNQGAMMDFQLYPR